MWFDRSETEIEIDLSRLPTGSRGWSALVAWAAASDDRQERYFLELKSDVDLTTKHGRHKVAKFILGAANRDSAKAAKRFGGHAVMLLGIGGGVAKGIPPFEAQDLEREIRKFTGADGPGWDFERISVDGASDVIAIIVDPPTGRIWPCLSDGEGMTNGDIYLRGDGRTEKATGGEVQAMLARTTASAASPKLPEITVEAVGTALAVQFDRERVKSWVEETTEDYLRMINTSKSAYPFEILANQGMLERRGKPVFRRQITRWSETSIADPASGLHELTARMAIGIRLRVTNPVATSLRDVRIDITFDDPIRALDWEDPEQDDRFELFPDRPQAWGRDSVAYMLGATRISSFVPPNLNGMVQIAQSAPAKLSLSLDLLRAKEVRLTDEDDIVLVLFVDSEPAAEIVAKWQLTAGDVHDVLEGTLAVPVDYRDWTPAIAEMLNDAAEDAEAAEQ